LLKVKRAISAFVMPNIMRMNLWLNVFFTLRKQVPLITSSLEVKERVLQALRESQWLRRLVLCLMLMEGIPAVRWGFYLLSLSPLP